MSDPGQEVAKTQSQPPATRKSLIETMAYEFDMEPHAFLDAIKQVVFPPADRKGNPPTNAQMTAYLAVCHQYGLNPFVKQLWPFPVKDGGFVPATSYDGWLYVENNHPQFDGEEPYEEVEDEKGNLIAGIITIIRKDRRKPIVHKERFSEWKRDTENWRNQPHHMLELRTRCQAIRKAFGISGIYDADEIARMDEEKNITGESTIISRETANKTELLKAKIGAKRDEKAQAQTAPATPAPEQAPVAPVAPPATPAPPQTAAAPQPPTPANPPIPEPPMENLFPSEPEPDRLLTELERQGILAQLKAKTPKDKSEELQRQARQFFMTLGCANTKELKLSDLPKVQEWIDNLKLGS